jgi:hypothetical protein
VKTTPGDEGKWFAAAKEAGSTLKAAEKNGTARDAREQIKSMVAERPGGFVAQILGRELGS